MVEGRIKRINGPIIFIEGLGECGLYDVVEVGEKRLVGEIIQIYDNFGIDTEIIVASIRHPFHFVQSALMGADIATIPFSTLGKLLNHPLTDIGIKRFLEDWQKVDK